MHASSGLQKPSHEGADASPHAVVRHSHAPPDATAEHVPPLPHVPSHFRELLLKSHGPGTVVVVVDVLVDVNVSGPRVAGMQSICAPRNLTTR